jgi:hypothetical protein
LLDQSARDQWMSAPWDMDWASRQLTPTARKCSEIGTLEEALTGLGSPRDAPGHGRGRDDRASRQASMRDCGAVKQEEPGAGVPRKGRARLRLFSTAAVRRDPINKSKCELVPPP